MGGRESFLPKNPSGILKKCTHAKDVLIHTCMCESVDLNIMIDMDVVRVCILQKAATVMCNYFSFLIKTVFIYVYR